MTVYSNENRNNFINSFLTLKYFWFIIVLSIKSKDFKPCFNIIAKSECEIQKQDRAI